MPRFGGLVRALCLLAAVGLPAAAQNTEKGVEDRLIVAFKANVTPQQQRQTLHSQGLTVLGEIPALRAFLVSSKPGLAPSAMGKLQAEPRVLAVQRDIWRKWIEAPASLQDVPMPSVESVLKQLPKLREPVAPKADTDNDGEAQWGIKRVNAPAAWASNQGSGVKVAVIDTGVDPEHPELKARVAGGYNALDKNAPWADDHSHGTHVAGIIAASMDGKGVVGVAPQASIYGVKVLTKEGSGNLFAIMDGIMWASQNGMQVINMSLGAPQEMPLLQYALQMAVGAGVTIVAAAGNDGKAVNWPAAYPESIAVAALCPPGVQQQKLCPTAAEGIATFSSRGPQVAFIAPGVLIPSTVPLFADASGIKAYSGTSMACPHVAGLAALAVAKGAQGPDGVRAALKAAAEPLAGHSPSEQGAGVVNAAKLAR